MIRKLESADFDSILQIIHDAAEIYKGIIPNDRWKEPYMSAEELREEIKSGVEFYGYIKNGKVLAVMGMQYVKDITLIRHSYVLSKYQKRGIGGRLLEYLKAKSSTPEVLVGTWRDASWAIFFYKKHGFKLVSEKEKNKLLNEYWNIPKRQIETSVVMVYNKSLL